MKMAKPIQTFWINMFPMIRGLSEKETKEFQVGLRYFSNVKAEKPPHQVPRERPAVKRRSPGGGGYPLLLIPLTCVGLGTWQIQRRGWKLNLIKQLEDKMKAQPLDLPENIDDLKRLEYCKVKVSGTFDHNRELFIGPRHNVHEPETMGSTRAQNVGVNVVTPFKLADRNETILVNRGHVTFKNQPSQLRLTGQIEGEVDIVGVIRLSDKKPIISHDPRSCGYWLTRNVEEMAEVAETVPAFIDADIYSTVPGGPQGGQTRVTLRNEHLTYIITWYSLATLTFILWYKNYRMAMPHSAVTNALKQKHKRQ